MEENEEIVTKPEQKSELTAEVLILKAQLQNEREKRAIEMMQMIFEWLVSNRAPQALIQAQENLVKGEMAAFNERWFPKPKEDKPIIQ